MITNKSRSLKEGSVKKILVLLLVTAVGAWAVLMNMACNANAPSSPNFQSPVQTISANNPTLTFTATFTSTFTPTFTPTGTPYPRGAAWTGFSNPSAIAVDKNGNVYVADTGNGRIGKYTSNGLLVGTWGVGLKGKVAYTNPVALAVDSYLNLYVAGNGVSISQYGPSGNLLNANLASAVANGSSTYTGLAVDSFNKLYISDAGNQQVVELTGSPVSFTVGAAMQGIAVDSTGDVFVAMGNTVREYTGGSLVTGIPGFVNPTGLAVDSQNNLWVADTGNKQVEEFPAGAYNQQPLAIFNDSGLLVSPKGVAVDLLGNIYVVDSGANDVFPFFP